MYTGEFKQTQIYGIFVHGDDAKAGLNKPLDAPVKSDIHKLCAMDQRLTSLTADKAKHPPPVCLYHTAVFPDLSGHGCEPGSTPPVGAAVLLR